MRIALATEGKSEHWIIKHIVENYFKGKEIFFRQIQPQIVDDTQESIGGWREILKFCDRTDDIKSALVDCDFLVIQIDTDESQNIHFGVSHTKEGNVKKTNEELYHDIIDKLKSLINSELLDEYEGKIVFAISINTIECWLLPIYFTNNHKSDTRNCLTTLNTELRRRDLIPIPPKKQKEKRKIVYESILRNWRRKRDITNAAQYNAGFSFFIDSLNSI
jgi:hypothetical protein